MKKRWVMVLMSAVLALGVSGAALADEDETELTAPSDTLEGTITEVDEDGEVIVLELDDGSEYTIFTTEAEIDLEGDSLEDGMYVSVTLQETTATDGSFTATEIEEMDAPEGESEDDSSDELVATSTDLTGYVYDADGSTLTLDGDDGNEYPIYYADASVEDTDDGLVDGSYCAITIADVNPSDDGNFTALDVEQLADPDENADGTTAADDDELVATSTDLTGYVYDADGSTLTLEGDDGNEYPIYYADASVEDTDDGLVDGSYCAITIADVNPSDDGNFTALDVEQLDDPDEGPDGDDDDELVATSTDLTGYVYDADGSTLTLEGDDGNEYPIYYADASVEDTDDGLVDGSYCAITIADVNPSDDGNFTALDVEQLDDPDEDPSETETED